MKEKLISIKNSLLNRKKSKSKYGLLLSVVALIEVLLIVLVSTYAWVETVSTIEISSSNSKIETYTFTNAEIGIGEGYSEPIDLDKYFRASGNVHLASASSANGKNFFFPEVAKASSSGASSFRLGTINDKNTNYIDFSFKIRAKGTRANFYFGQVPTFFIGDQQITDNTIRMAISVANTPNDDSDVNVYSYQHKESEFVVGDVDGSTVTSTRINAFSDFDNTLDPEENILFTVPKDEERYVTIKLWLQDPEKTAEYAGKQVVCENFQLVTSVKTTTINFIDRTSEFNSSTAPDNTWQWVGNNNSKLWLVGAAQNILELKQKANDPTFWFATVPTEELGNISGDMYFYRTPSTSTESSNLKNDCTHYWKTKLSLASTGTVPTYTAYGGKIKSGSNECRGTWGPVAEIKLLGDNAENIIPTPSSGLTAKHVTVTSTSNLISTPMNYNNGFWRAYVTVSENAQGEKPKNYKFSFDSNDINAPNRDTSESSSTFRVTSAKTGYWEAPAIVNANVAAGYSDMGSVSVSGGPDGVASVKVTSGTSVTLTATPYSDNYSFEGWYWDADCTRLASSNSQMNFVASEKKATYNFYAKFQFNVRLTAKTDGVVGNSDGGTVQINDGTAGSKVSLNVQKGDSVVIKALTNEEDYEFMGWFNSKGELVYPNNQSVVTITNLTTPIDLYASFNVKHFVLEAFASTNGEKENSKGGTVKFDGLTTSSAHATVTVAYTGEATFVANVNTADGYEFKGWFSDEACTKLVTLEPNYVANKHTEFKTMYAKFELKKYKMEAVAVTNLTSSSSVGGTVQIVADGVTSPAGTTATGIATHGTTVKFVATANAGYRFMGWYNAPVNGTKKSEYATYNKTGISGNAKYYAVFKKEFDVQLISKTDGVVSGAGGSVKAGTDVIGATSNFTVVYGDNITIQALVRDDSYSFVNWSNDSITYTNATQELTNITSDIILYANFAKKTFTIKAYAVSESGTGGTVSFDTEENSGAYVTTTVEYDGSVTFKAFVKNSDAYEFKGWHRKADCSDTAISSTVSYTMTGIQANQTLYAQFMLKRYTVTAHVITTDGQDAGTVSLIEGGTATSTSTEVTKSSVVHGTEVTFRANPATGAEFLGWYSASTGGTRLDNPASTKLTITVTSNTDVYARFKNTKKTTIIYFAERSGYTSYNAYVYNDKDTGVRHNGNWPGTALTKDDTTGYYKLSFDSDKTNGFRVIISNNTNNQYPAVNQPGLYGDYGKSYIFAAGEPKNLVEYNPVMLTIGASTVNTGGTFESDGFTGGSVKVGTETYTSKKVVPFNKSESATITATAKSGYVFSGWYSNAQCTGTALSTTASATVSMSADKTYYAKFVEEAKVTIYLVDSTSDTWLDKDMAIMVLRDKVSGIEYTWNYIDKTHWYCVVDKSLNSCELYRKKSDGTDVYNSWKDLTRGNNNLLTVTGSNDNDAKWSVKSN